MYILIGVSWLVYWALIKVFSVDAIDALLTTAIIFVVIGLVIEGYPRLVRRP